MDDNEMWTTIWHKFQALRGFFDFGMAVPPEQKKQLFNDLIHQFKLYRDGRIEVEFKLTASPKQVVESVVTITNGKLV